MHAYHNTRMIQIVQLLSIDNKNLTNSILLEKKTIFFMIYIFL
jgi:hypothetical protein